MKNLFIIVLMLVSLVATAQSGVSQLLQAITNNGLTVDEAKIAIEKKETFATMKIVAEYDKNIDKLLSEALLVRDRRGEEMINKKTYPENFSREKLELVSVKATGEVAFNSCKIRCFQIKMQYNDGLFSELTRLPRFFRK